MKELTQKETNDILGFFRDQVEEDGELNMDEIAEYEGSINMMNPLHIKEFFSKPNNKQYFDKYWKSIVAKWEGQQKPSGDSKPKPKPTVKKVKQTLEEAKIEVDKKQELSKLKLKEIFNEKTEKIPPSVPLPPVTDTRKLKQKLISFNPPPPEPPKEDSNAKLKQRQQAMKDKLKKINDENKSDNRLVVPPQPKKITSPNGFGAFETYLLLRIQPDKDNEANNLIKMLERNFVERGFNATTVKDIKKILKLAKYKDLVIAQEIQERINNPVVPSVVPSVVPVAPSEVPQPKKRGRPPKKKIPEGSNKLVLMDNIIKKNNEVTKMLKDYYNFVYEEGSQ